MVVDGNEGKKMIAKKVCWIKDDVVVDVWKMKGRTG